MPGLNNDFHSEEAREIMGSMPPWIVRWGITVLCLILVGIVAGCYFIKYPETVKGTIVITTANPPSDLIVRYDGLIQDIPVVNGQEVRRGDLIAVISNPADYASVKKIEEGLQGTADIPLPEFVYLPFMDSDYKLGDLQGSYSEFRKQCRDYRHYIELGAIRKKQILITEQIDKNREYYRQLQNQLALLQEELELEIKNYRRDSVLYGRELISAVEFDNSTKGLLQKRNNVENFRASMIGTELTIIQNEQQIIDLATQLENETASYERTIDQARQNLLSQIAQWKVQYVIESPTDGRVTFTNYWSDNQRVAAGERLASVIPDKAAEVMGRMYVPSSGLGKVKEGQTVNVKLSSYPYMEFGMLKGKVKSISAVPERDAGYVAEVSFPEHLTTTYKKEITLIQQMDGEGEIITEDARLIQRFIQPIRALFRR